MLGANLGSLLYVDVSVMTVKPVLSDHINQDMVLVFKAGGCLLLYESSAESSGV